MKKINQYKNKLSQLKLKTSRSVSANVDYDYLHKLTAEELLFLEAFNRAEYSGNTQSLERHRKLTDKQRKEFYDANNARKRDIMNIESNNRKDVESFETVSADSDNFAEYVEAKKALNGKRRNRFRKN